MASIVKCNAGRYREAVEGFPNQQIGVTPDSSGPSVQQTEPHAEDSDIERAVSLSLKEMERQSAAKEASLPMEPTLGEENAVTLLVQMPDVNRRGRRFLKSDSLQSLFDFIDVGRVVKPGTYRMVK
ncbi:hypothetical protein ACHQM5_000830 [Ranunculus cassubicifolius]